MRELVLEVTFNPLLTSALQGMPSSVTVAVMPRCMNFVYNKYL